MCGRTAAPTGVQENGGDGRAPGREPLLYVPGPGASVAKRGHFARERHLVQCLEQPGRIVRIDWLNQSQQRLHRALRQRIVAPQKAHQPLRHNHRPAARTPPTKRGCFVFFSPDLFWIFFRATAFVNFPFSLCFE